MKQNEVLEKYVVRKKGFSNKQTNKFKITTGFKNMSCAK